MNSKLLLSKIQNSPEVNDFVSNHEEWDTNKLALLKAQISSKYGEIEDHFLEEILKKAKLKYQQKNKSNQYKENNLNLEEKKKCQYCKELIKGGAHICPYCQSIQKTWEEIEAFVKKIIIDANSDMFKGVGIVGVITISVAFKIATWLGILSIVLISIGAWWGYNFYIEIEKENYYNNNPEDKIIEKMIAAEQENRRKQEINRKKTIRRFRWVVAILITLTTLCIYYLKPFDVEYDFESFEINRNSWDTLSILTTYKRTIMLQSRYAYPNREKIIVRDANYNVLYEGTNLEKIGIPDKLLSSNEKINIEIIAYFDDGQISKEKYIFASEKKITMHHSISYPKGNFAKGSYLINFSIKRKSFNSNEFYETLYKNVALPIELKIYTKNNKNLYAQFKTKDSNGFFDLSKYPDYNRLKNNMISELEKNRQVEVQFVVTAEYRGKKIYYPPITKRIKEKSEQEKINEAQNFANKIGNKIAKIITPNTGNTVNVYIDNNNIEYDLHSMRYTIPMKITWWGATWIFGEEHKMAVEGVLSINEDGSNPKFEKTWTNDYVETAIENNMLWELTTSLLNELDKYEDFD